MDRQYIDDNSIIARYVADHLDERESERFEKFCLDNPDVAREVADEQSLRAAFGDAGTLAFASAQPHSSGRPTRTRRETIAWAASGVASVAAVAAIGAWIGASSELATFRAFERNTTKIQANIPIVSLGVVRNSQQDATARLRGDELDGWFLLELELAPGPGQDYRVEIRTPDGRVVTAEDAYPDYRDVLVLGVDAELLGVGRHTVLVNAGADDGGAQSFAFEVVP